MEEDGADIDARESSRDPHQHLVVLGANQSLVEWPYGVEYRTPYEHARLEYVTTLKDGKPEIE
jgi:hypothetical protein